jgi:hypothetical protein
MKNSWIAAWRAALDAEATACLGHVQRDYREQGHGSGAPASHVAFAKVINELLRSGR